MLVYEVAEESGVAIVIIAFGGFVEERVIPEFVIGMTLVAILRVEGVT